MLYQPDFGNRRLPLLKLLLDHQRWLNSKGRFGAQLGDPFGEDRAGLLFYYCDLDGVDLSSARLEGAYFEGGSAKGARFVGADLTCSTFESCDVEGADFSKARLDWSTFAANHEQAQFDGASCDHIAFTMEERSQNRRLLSTLRHRGFGLVSRPSRRLGRSKDEFSP